MIAKYLNTDSFVTAKEKAMASAAWKGILESRDRIQERMHWIIGNGEDINFWLYNWCFNFPLINLFPENLRTSINLQEKVSDCIINGRWATDRLPNILPSDTNFFIHGIPIPFFPSEDSFIWNWSSRKFLIKSATNLTILSA